MYIKILYKIQFVINSFLKTRNFFVQENMIRKKLMYVRGNSALKARDHKVLMSSIIFNERESLFQMTCLPGKKKS